MYGRFRKNMTAAMLTEADFIDGMIYDEIALCIRKANDCAAAMVRLPATAASGESVVFGANNDVSTLIDYWVARLRAAGSLLPVDEFRATVQQHSLHSRVAKRLGGI